LEKEKECRSKKKERLGGGQAENFRGESKKVGSAKQVRENLVEIVQMEMSFQGGRRREPLLTTD